MSDVTMPRLSDSMEEGTILNWLVEDGATVARGDEIVEVETDKANMPYEADAAGVLTIVAGEGETVAVGQLIARIGEPAAPRPAEPEPSAPAPPPVSDNGGGEVTSAPGAPAPPAPSATATAPRPKASPLARRVARELNVDLTALTGTGRTGRIVKADVLAAIPDVEEPAPASATAPPPSSSTEHPAESPAVGSRGRGAVQELTRLQRTVARRMSEAKATVPEFTVTAVADMESAIAARAELKALIAEDAPAPSYNDMVIKACAGALRAHQRVNGSFSEKGFVLHDEVNVGMAVAGADSLVVPVVRHADRKGLGDIAHETRGLASAVRNGEITPRQLDGCTFTVSNLGMLGVDEFTAVINLPQAAILAVGAMKPQAAVHEGKLTARHQMRLSLTCDHRIIYGADAARFLSDVRHRLEQPLSMLL